MRYGGGSMTPIHDLESRVVGARYFSKSLELLRVWSDAVFAVFADSPTCDIFGKEEDVRHVLCDCPSHADAR